MAKISKAGTWPCPGKRAMGERRKFLLFCFEPGRRREGRGPGVERWVQGAVGEKRLPRAAVRRMLGWSGGGWKARGWGPGKEDPVSPGVETSGSSPTTTTTAGRTGTPTPLLPHLLPLPPHFHRLGSRTAP